MNQKEESSTIDQDSTGGLSSVDEKKQTDAYNRAIDTERLSKPSMLGRVKRSFRKSALNKTKLDHEVVDKPVISNDQGGTFQESTPVPEAEVVNLPRGAQRAPQNGRTRRAKKIEILEAEGSTAYFADTKHFIVIETVWPSCWQAPLRP
jgi:hypothetical protein